ncbi:MAG: hypothetical protein M1813_003921 [Trichoglossum hirsutum]|nr:MAG: hypothetical protein M1813_003921 [Trichoglossum hirsutum]
MAWIYKTTMADILDGGSSIDVDPHGLRQSDPVRTLLPSPLASIVSLTTRSSSIYLRVGTFIGGLALDGARITTLTGLEVGRSMVEGILLRAGRDVASRSNGQLGKLEAENALERSIIYLHSAFTKASFVASTGFGVSSAALLSMSSLSMHLLYALDSILGSTESSRAIASIITLIRREFRNPETGARGECVGVADLLIGISGLALVQGWCRNRTEKLIRESCTEETVWDVVVLDNGRRADVVAVSSKDQSNDMEIEAEGREGSDDLWNKHRATSFVSTTGGQEVIQAIEHVDDSSSEPSSSVESPDQEVGDFWPEKDFPRRLMAQLPPNAEVSVTTSTRTTKTVTVEILGAEPPDLSPPPGAIIIEESSHHRSAVNAEAKLGASLTDTTLDAHSPRYRVVYQTTQNKSRRASTGGEEDADFEWSEPASSRGAGDIMPMVHESPFPTIGNSERTRDTASKGMQTGHRRTPPGSPLAKTRKPTGFHSDTFGGKGLGLKPRSNTANQKRPRKPMSSSSSHNASNEAEKKKTSKRKSSIPKLPHKATSEKTEKMKTLKRAFKKGASNTALGNLWGKDSVPDTVRNTRKGKEQRPPWGSNQGQFLNKSLIGSSLPTPQWRSSLVASKDLPGSPQRDNPNYFSSSDLGQKQDVPRSSSRASYYSIHERRRDSVISQTDTYSIQPVEQLRPGSPSHLGSHAKSSASLLRARSAKDITVNATELPATSSPKNHRRSKSYAPSIYTLRTNDSETSLVLANPCPKSAFDDRSAIMSLNRSGYVPNLFPLSHFVHNVTRFMRFASASYGSDFLRLMGITSQKVDPDDVDTLRHPEQHYSFARHAGLPASTILLSSHFDSQGGSNSTGETDTGIPMVHFVSLDHSSKAVVLTCRGTLGFEDVLTDLSCEYDDIVWRHRTYKVHKGMHASARKLLEGGGGKVMATIRVALEQYPEYGLILCGHSLGAGVTAILSILLSEPDMTGSSGSAFVTTPSPSEAPLLMGSTSNQQKHNKTTPLRRFWLPGGRPIHVYAYGPPGTVSSSLRVATRGLITTIINGQDLVPHLSLGVLHDLQGVALAFKTDTSGAKSEVRKRFWAGLTAGLAGELFGQPCGHIGEESDDWALSALKSLRVNMLSTKLMPPGEVFVIESMPVLQRDAFTPGGQATADGYPKLGRPATRAVLKLVRDVDGRFGEVRFGGSMLGDHSPGRYERSLSALGKGVLGDEG